MSDTSKRDMLRHYLAALAYRATKAIKDAPEEYPDLYVGTDVRTPREILGHISGVLAYAHSHFVPYETTYFPLESWDRELARFYEILEDFDESLADGTPLNGTTEERLLQGPLSDAMTHVGQLAMLRRIAGSSIPAENFIKADIQVGRVGPDQPEPVAPD